MNGETMDESSPVDSGQMERLKEWGGPELQKKMIDLFLTHARERLDQISKGISSGAMEEAERGAHTLKSSAGNVGARRVQALAQDAESLAEAGRLDDLRGLLPSLEREFQTACDALRTVLEGADS
jgi:HPt (histidine-containing phosphotransfer) domain-containing protein